MTHPHGPSRFQDQPQRSKSGQWPNFWKSASWLPKQLEYSSHSLAYEITHSYKSWRGLSRWLSGKESVCNAGNPGLILGQEDPLEEEMATHSCILAWKIPWTGEPCRLQSTESQRVRYDWASAFGKGTNDMIVSLCSVLLYFAGSSINLCSLSRK